MTKEIAITRGLATLVDDDLYEELNRRKWCVKVGQQTVYACRGIPRVTMHRQIMNALPGQQVDHINHNGLDNRRENLRICTAAENQQNARKTKHPKSSRYKGVHWSRGREKWRAMIRMGGRLKHLGYFDSEIDAARSYNEAAKEAWGEFAYLNDLAEDVI